MGEHGNHHAIHNLKLCPVKGSDLNKDIGGVEGNLRVVAVDDRGQGADSALRVIDHRVHGRVANDVQVLAQLLVLLWFVRKYSRVNTTAMVCNTYFVESHQFLTIHLLGLVKGDKFDVRGRKSLVGERPLDGIQIVGTNGDQGSLTGQILVKLVLQGNERLIASLVELDTSEYGTRHVGPDLRGLLIYFSR